MRSDCREDPVARWLGRFVDGVAGVQVRAPVREPDRVSFLLEHPRGRCRVFLFDSGSGREAYRTRPGLAIAYRDEEGFVDAALVDEVFRRFAVFDFVALAAGMARVQRRARTGSDWGVPPGAGRLDRFHNRPDRRDAWFRFCYPEPLYLDSIVEMPQGTAWVQHGTRECEFTTPRLNLPPLRTFSGRNWTNATVDTQVRTPTDLREEHVLGGRTLDRLREVMDSCCRRPGVRAVCLSTTCLPELIGDDPTPILQDLEASRGVRTFWTSKTRDPTHTFHAWFRQSLGAIPFCEPRDPDLVIVVGLVDPRHRREVADLLQGIGLRVAGFLMPPVDLHAIPDIERVRAVVWGNPIGWQAHDESLSRAFQVVRAPPPVGVRATLHWLRAVGLALGLDRDDLALDRVREAFEEARTTLRGSTSGLTAGLIGDRDDIETLLRPQVFGFSVGEVLIEMGFRVRCLVHEPERPDGTPLPADPGAGVEFVTFRSPKGLDEGLAGLDLAFTHFRHDPRLAAHGLRGFCEDDFEPGVQGFRRAGERLLTVARGRWAARYRRHLTRWTA